jgi:hypothetical protein
VAITVLGTASEPLPGRLGQLARAVVVLVALIPLFLLGGELAAGISRAHRRRVLRRAIRAAPEEP